MSDAKLDMISSKLDKLTTTQTKLQVSIGKQQTHHENYQKTMDRFWTVTWPDVIEKIDANSTRIATLEVDIARIKTMVLVWGSFITVAVALSVPVIQYYLEKKS